jgi:hypothetical protein
MKKLLFACFFAILCCGLAGGTNPTLGGAQANAHCGSCTTTNSTGSGPLTVGSQILAFAVCTGVTSSTLGISDAIAGGGSNTWTNTPVNSTYSGATVTGVVSVWEVLSSVTQAGNDVYTVTSTATCTDFDLFTVQGANFAAQDAGPSGASGLSSGTITQGFPTELVLGFTAGGNGGTNPAAGSGYTLISSNGTGGANPGWEYLVATTCGTQQAVFTAGTGTLYTNILTFKGSTPGSSCSASANAVIGGAATFGGKGVIQ